MAAVCGLAEGTFCTEKEAAVGVGCLHSALTRRLNAYSRQMGVAPRHRRTTASAQFPDCDAQTPGRKPGDHNYKRVDRPSTQLSGCHTAQFPLRPTIQVITLARQSRAEGSYWDTLVFPDPFCEAMRLLRDNVCPRHQCAQRYDCRLEVSELLG